MATSKDLVITLPDYERIFRVIHGVLLNERCDPAHACMYFGIFGTFILQKHHRVKAEPVFGMAAYRLAGNVVLFAEQDADLIQGTPNGFHCWIEADGIAVDFQAPLFRDITSRKDPPVTLDRKMIQKRLDLCSPTLEHLDKAGSHWYKRDDQLRSELLTNFIQKQANEDLGQICLEWYKPTPKKIAESILIGNQRGHSNNVPLSPVRLSGAW